MPDILITSAGRRVSLVQYFKNEVQQIFGNNSKVYTTDLEPELSTACRTSDGYFTLGKFSDSNYIPDLLTICKENKISIIIPTIDTELLLYASQREKFLQEGIELLVSDLPLVETLRNKLLTNDFFLKKGFKIPTLLEKAQLTFPLFIKPINGSSSVSTFKIENEDQLSKEMLDNKQLLFMHYLDPKVYDEYTIDLYYNKSGILKCMVPRLRISTRSGEINKGITKKNDLIPFVKDKMCVLEGARGCLTLQVFFNRENKDVYGIEINPRFGGGFPLTYLAGANYIKWILEEYLRNQEIEYFDGWEENLLLLRHDNEMIVHGFNY
jgi:carbamoyl-phosphate synthase large subunit